MIDGVSITTLKVIPDERGCVRHFIRSDEPDFRGFGETYITEVYKGMVKAWHGYPTKVMHYTVVRGMVRLVLWDNRVDSPTFRQLDVIFLGRLNYSRVTIPPGVFNGFKGIQDSVVVVTASEPFSEKRIIRYPEGYFPYEW